MPPNERAQLVAELFKSAIEQTPEDRTTFLREHCASDPRLRAEVESLLQTHNRAQDFLERPAAEAFRCTGAFPPGAAIGHYEIVSLIGQGGMGEVYLAQDRHLGRRVALKLIRRGLDTDPVLRRFQHEQQLLAGLNHPNIAQLYEAGVTADGIPFFAMENVEGVRIDDDCRNRNLGIAQRLELFCKVCAAIDYAHQHLVVHRDIKPSNILVTAAGEPKLLDFGIAKLIDAMSHVAPAQTITLQNVLTPEYASPEHVRGEPITTVSDVYSLGVLLYELLTGAKPYKIETRTPLDIARIVAEQAPTPPSATRELKSETRKLLRGDLDNIVLMAMRKEPARRYPSVAQFAADIRRHLDRLPVRARRDTFAYRSSKFIRRHRVGVAAATVVIVSLVGGFVATIWQAQTAKRAQAKAERVSQFLAEALSYSDPSAAVAGTKNRRDATINQMLDDVAPRIERELADQPDVCASLQRTVGLAYASQMRRKEAEHYLEAALATQTRLYGATSPELTATLIGLATLSNAKGALAESEKGFQRVIAIYRVHPPVGENATTTFVQALVGLGDVQWSQGKYADADSAQSEALAVASKLQNSELVADAKTGLGLTRYSQGKLDEAAQLLRAAANDLRNLPATRWKLPITLTTLGQVLFWKNEFAEAIAVLRESQAIALEIWGEDNELYPRALWVSAYALCLTGRYAEAQQAVDKTQEIYSRILPDNKGYMANVYDARNFLLTRTGRAAEGEWYGRKAIELYPAIVGHGSPSITLARAHLAQSLTAQNKFEEAERVLLEAYKDAREAYGKEYYRTREAARELAKFYEMRGQPREAEKYRALGQL